MNRGDIIRMKRERERLVCIAKETLEVHTDERGRETFSGDFYCLEKFAALVAKNVHKTYNRVGMVAGGGGCITYMQPEVRYLLPLNLPLYARIEVREEDKV